MGLAQPKDFNKFYEQNEGALKSHVRFKVGNSADCDDLCQETWARFYKASPRVEEYLSPKGFLFQIANNLVANFYRGRQRETEMNMASLEQLTEEDWDHLEWNIFNNHHSTDENPIEAVLKAERLAAMAIASNRLPEKEREAYEMVDLKKKSNEEAAKELGISLPTLYQRLSRARKKINQMIASEL